MENTHRIIEWPELKGAHKDHRAQLLAHLFARLYIIQTTSLDLAQVTKASLSAIMATETEK